LLPAKMAELTDASDGEFRLRQSGDPEPLVIGRVQDRLALAKSISLQYFLGADHSHRFRVVDGERQSGGVPKLDVVGFMILLLGEAGVGQAPSKQAHGGLI